jgi:hypothetical protein
MGNLLRNRGRGKFVVILMTVFRNRRIAVITLFSCLLATHTFFLPRSVSASVIWADDFENRDYDGWTVNLGSFSASDNTLRAEGYVLNAISHPSSVVVGTWRIDLEFTDIPHYSSIYIFVEDIGQGIGNNGYWLYITNWRVTLHLETEFVTDPIANYSFPKPINGWQHFDVTRDVTGLIRTYINGTLCMEVIHTQHNTANYFLVQLRDGDAVDNVEVSNTIDIEPYPTSPPFQPVPIFVVISFVLAATLFVSVILGLALRRWHHVFRT